MTPRRAVTRFSLGAVAIVLPVLVPPAAAGNAPEKKTPVTLRIEIMDRSQLERLTRMISIDDVRGREVRAVATPEQLEALEAAGWSFEVMPRTADNSALVMCREGWEDDENRTWNCYPTYRQYVALMQLFASERPDLCQLVDLGPSANLVRPHRLWAVVVSDHPGEEEAEPEVLLTSTMHGDETSGFVLMLRLIDHLLEGHGSDPAITALVDETELWINPLANPDGTYFGGDDSVAGAIRFYTTSSGGVSSVDANRNFPTFAVDDDHPDPDHPDGNPWWPETEAMMALAESQTFVLSANLHDGSEVVNYPWDAVERRHPDDVWFRSLAQDWADLAQADGPAGYMTEVERSGVTNGYDWYQIIGGRQDFTTYFHGGREITVELSRAKLLPAADLDDLWSWNQRALLDFITHAQEGIRGIVTDANGSPVEASVEVLGVDREDDGSTVRTDPEVGDYHRLLLPGLYDLRVEAPDFQTRELYGIAVTEGVATRVDVVLHRVLRRPSRRIATDPDTTEELRIAQE